MSASGGHRSQLSYGVMAAALALLLVLTKVFSSGGDNLLGALGFLLLAGTLAGELFEPLKLPHLTAYLITGLIAGPHLLGLVGHHAVEEMTFVNSLALALIALAGGAELKIEVLRQELRSISVANALHIVLGAPLIALVFYLARPMIPFAQQLTPMALLGVALLWGATAVSRSPAATLALLSQTRAKGPLANNALAFIMLSDAAVAVFFSVVLVLARPMIDPSVELSLKELGELGHELLGSVAVGTTMGLLLAGYMRLVGAQMQLVLLVLGFVIWETLRYLHFDTLLTFLVAGFVVQNLSNQGPAFLHAVERLSSVVFVLFFTSAGAHLDLPLLGKMWPVALLLAGSRAVIATGISKLSSRLVNDHPMVARWGWTSLVSQAGLTLGLVIILERAFPAFGGDLRSLGVATVAINEMVGPLLFKMGLDRAGETSHEPEPTRPAPEGEAS
ncbi:MAG: cation:proton antiporter [Polyangiaceae bacterium]|nr:cation:proton antiporter [Polyangiaceae bacterium]